MLIRRMNSDSLRAERGWCVLGRPVSLLRTSPTSRSWDRRFLHGAIKRRGTLRPSLPQVWPPSRPPPLPPHVRPGPSGTTAADYTLHTERDARCSEVPRPSCRLTIYARHGSGGRFRRRKDQGVDRPGEASNICEASSPLLLRLRSPREAPRIGQQRLSHTRTDAHIHHARHPPQYSRGVSTQVLAAECTPDLKGEGRKNQSLLVPTRTGPIPIVRPASGCLIRDLVRQMRPALQAARLGRRGGAGKPRRPTLAARGKGVA